MKKSDLKIGALIFDKSISDYGIIIACKWTEENRKYKYYLIHWQKETRFNGNKENSYKWPAYYLHSRIRTGEVVVVYNEKKENINT